MANGGSSFDSDFFSVKKYAYIPILFSLYIGNTFIILS